MTAATTEPTQIATIFIGGSRHVSRLSPVCKQRLDTIIDNGHRVVVGDAAGADKAVQKHMHARGYSDVTVFCTGARARNNLGKWPTCNVEPPASAKGFSFYAAKDRVMAKQADFGMMIWDGKSPGTLLNVLRLVRAGRIAVLLDASAGVGTTFRTLDDWSGFLKKCPVEVVDDIAKRATPEEWVGKVPGTFLVNDVQVAGDVDGN